MKISDYVFAHFEGNRALPRIAGYGFVDEIRADRLVAVCLSDNVEPSSVRGRTVLFDVDKVTPVHTPAETAELERLTREAYEAGVRVTMASMGVVQVSNTDDGLQAYGHNMTPAEARELARKITEAADALDPFPNDEKISTDSDPPKCPDCKGTGKVVLYNTVDECALCLGSGY